MYLQTCNYHLPRQCACLSMCACNLNYLQFNTFYYHFYYENFEAINKSYNVCNMKHLTILCEALGQRAMHIVPGDAE